MGHHHCAAARRPEGDPMRKAFPLTGTASRRRHGSAAGLVLLALAATGCRSDEVTASTADRVVASPVPVAGDLRLAQLSAGLLHSCGIDPTGLAWCWGSNRHRQLGVEPSPVQCEGQGCARSPVRAAGAMRFRAIGAGATHSCAITIDGRTVCWGGGPPSQPTLLGDGATVESAAPVTVDAGVPFAQLAVGGTHSCALTVDGAAWCWGRNDSGQLGDGTTVARGRPVRVDTDDRFMAIAAGQQHSCAITVDGAARCWGSNVWGQLGAGDVENQDNGVRSVRPVAVQTTARWRAIAAGGEHSCALALDGLAWCWGRNDNARQLGDASQVRLRSRPGAVLPRRPYEAITLGATGACGRMESGTVWCWGGNFLGELGNGRSNSWGEPMPTLTLGGPVAQMSLGGSHGCGIAAGGTVRCWGDARFGQVGHR
jgi:alpha-tubulin suppressor-like RCC1 family protein